MTDERLTEIDGLSQRLESYLPITANDSLRVAKELYDNGYRLAKADKARPVDREKIVRLLSSGMLRRSDALNGVGELLEEDTYFFITKKYKGFLADQIIASLNPEVIRREVAEEIFDWGNEPCPHAGRVLGEAILNKKDCYICWQSLESRLGGGE